MIINLSHFLASFFLINIHLTLLVLIVEVSKGIKMMRKISRDTIREMKLNIANIMTLLLTKFTYKTSKHEKIYIEERNI